MANGKKVRVLLEVEIELDKWSDMTPQEAAYNVQRRIGAFLYPVGMSISTVQITDVLVKPQRLRVIR